MNSCLSSLEPIPAEPGSEFCPMQVQMFCGVAKRENIPCLEQRGPMWIRFVLGKVGIVPVFASGEGFLCVSVQS